MITIGESAAVSVPAEAGETALHGRIRFTFARELAQVAQSGGVDALLLSTKNGLAPLGAARRFFGPDLGIPVRELSELARWAHYANTSVSLVALASRNAGSALKGVVIAPAESAKCYQQFAGQGGPGHDFRYRVWLEAIAYAGTAWGARCLAIDNFSLAEGGIANSHLQGVRRLSAERTVDLAAGRFRIEERGGAQVIHLRW
jgi:hypothetical protein